MTDKDIAKNIRNIRAEIKLLQRRLFLLINIEGLYRHNPPFFDDEKDRIVEPYKTFLRDYADVCDGEMFITRLHKLQMDLRFLVSA